MAKNFMVGIRDYFGYRNEEFRGKDDKGEPLSGLKDFSSEVKALTPADKLEIAKGIRAAGFECDDPVNEPASK